MEISAFNIRKLTNNGQITRVLHESAHGNFALEIIGPNFASQPECDFIIDCQDEILKRDIYTLLKYVVLVETYPKQQFTIIIEGGDYQGAVNSLFYAVILHGIRIKDSFACCGASLKPDLQQGDQMIVIYSIHQKRVISLKCQHFSTRDEYSTMMSACVSGCVAIFDLISQLNN